jgi:hypothetical protein
LLENVDVSAMGVRVLAALKALFLRVAVMAEGVEPTLSASNVESLFALSGSHVAAKRLYDGGLSLPSKLPHRRANELLGALYEAVAAVRLTEVGLVVSNLLLDVSAQADTAGLAAPIDAFVAAIEPLMKAKLTITDTSGGGSSSSSAAAPDASAEAMPPRRSWQCADGPQARDGSLLLCGANYGQCAMGSVRIPTNRKEGQLKYKVSMSAKTIPLDCKATAFRWLVWPRRCTVPPSRWPPLPMYA